MNYYLKPITAVQALQQIVGRTVTVVHVENDLQLDSPITIVTLDDGTKLRIYRFNFCGFAIEEKCEDSAASAAGPAS